MLGVSLEFDYICISALDIMAEREWFALRVKYVKAQKMVALLSQCAVPLESCFVPPVNGLLFLLTTREVLDDFMHFHSGGQYLAFIWDRTTGKPVVVKKKAMEDFMAVCRVVELPIVMTEKPQVTLGARVRVLEGPLKGIEGRVVRMKKSRRILVEVDGVLWAATEFISPEFLEVIED